MFKCDLCGYESYYKHNLDRHNTTKRHLFLQKKEGQKEDQSNYKPSDLDRHNLEHEITKLKMEVKMKDSELIYKDKLAESQKNEAVLQIKNEALQSQLNIIQQSVINKNHPNNSSLTNQHNVQNNIQQTGININGKVNKVVSKRNHLNINFSGIMDIDTFIDNYKNKYPLTFEQTKVLLENYQHSGLKSYGCGLYDYLKKNCAKQLEDIYGENIDEVILPFILSDASLRTHIEKTEKGWKYEQAMNKIKKIVIISNDQIYKHHNTRIPLGPTERILVANSLLRCSSYPNNKSTIKEK